jgi:hypothetical protein
MRKTIILGSLIALLGLGSAAQASDHSDLNNGTQVRREASNDGRGDRNRSEHGRRSGDDRQHEFREHGRRSSENHDAHERREHR